MFNPAAAEGPYLVGLCLILLYFFLGIAMGEIAGHLVGRKLFWMIAFILLPGISHALFILQYNEISRKRREVKTVQKLIYDAPSRGTRSVTPFNNPEMEDRRVSSDEPHIAGGRDEKIDSLMAHDEWTRAEALAGLNLELARKSGDPASARVYEDYLELIEPNVSGLPYDHSADYEYVPPGNDGESPR